MSESLIIEEGKTPLPPIESESIETVSTFAGGKKPVEIPIITTSKAEDLFVDVPAWKKVTEADIKKSVKNEVIKNSSTITVLAGASMAAGTTIGSTLGMPVIGALVSKLVPLGYVGYKAAAIASRTPEEFWYSMYASENQVTTQSGFWRGVGKAYLFGTAEESAESLSEEVGNVAGTLMRDFTLAHGIGRVFVTLAGGKRFYDMANASDKVSRLKAQKILEMSNAFALSGSMGVNHAIDRYYEELGAGTPEKQAMQAAMASGIATGASGVAFLGFFPHVVKRFAGTVFDTFPKTSQMVMSSAEWTGWSKAETDINNVIRTGIYDLPEDPEMDMTGYATVAGIGASFSLAGIMAGALFTTAGRGIGTIVDKATSKAMGRKKAAQDFAEAAAKVDFPDNGVKVSKEVAEVNGYSEEAIQRASRPTIKIEQEQSPDTVEIKNDFSDYPLTSKQIQFLVDTIREKVNNGIDYDEAIKQAWQNAPLKLRNPKNFERLMRALEK